MTSTDTTIREQVEQDAERIKRAVDRGGLPTEAETAEVWRALVDVSDRLEGITLRCEGISHACDQGDLPFTITLADLGVIAVLTDDVAGHVDELKQANERIRQTVSELNSIRLEQARAES